MLIALLIVARLLLLIFTSIATLLLMKRALVLIVASLPVLRLIVAVIAIPLRLIIALRLTAAVPVLVRLLLLEWLLLILSLTTGAMKRILKRDLVLMLLNWLLHVMACTLIRMLLLLRVFVMASLLIALLLAAWLFASLQLLMLLVRRNHLIAIGSHERCRGQHLLLVWRELVHVPPRLHARQRERKIALRQRVQLSRLQWEGIRHLTEWGLHERIRLRMLRLELLLEVRWRKEVVSGSLLGELLLNWRWWTIRGLLQLQGWVLMFEIVSLLRLLAIGCSIRSLFFAGLRRASIAVTRAAVTLAVSSTTPSTASRIATPVIRTPVATARVVTVVALTVVIASRTATRVGITVVVGRGGAAGSLSASFAHSCLQARLLASLLAIVRRG